MRSECRCPDKPEHRAKLFNVFMRDHWGMAPGCRSASSHQFIELENAVAWLRRLDRQHDTDPAATQRSDGIPR